MKIKSLECPKSIKNYEKKNTWNVKRLVDNSVVPSTHQTRVLYNRLTDFYIHTLTSRNPRNGPFTNYIDKKRWVVGLVGPKLLRFCQWRWVGDPKTPKKLSKTNAPYNMPASFAR